jgi:hypothetical protein
MQDVHRPNRRLSGAGFFGEERFSTSASKSGDWGFHSKEEALQFGGAPIGSKQRASLWENLDWRERGVSFHGSGSCVRIRKSEENCIPTEETIKVRIRKSEENAFSSAAGVRYMLGIIVIMSQKLRANRMKLRFLE